MPREVQFIEFGVRVVAWVDATISQNENEILAMQDVQRHERTPPAPHLFHGRLVSRAPPVGERVGIESGDSVTRKELRNFARYAAAPINDRSEDVENDGTNT